MYFFPPSHSVNSLHVPQAKTGLELHTIQPTVSNNIVMGLSMGPTFKYSSYWQLLKNLADPKGLRKPEMRNFDVDLVQEKGEVH